MTSKFFFSLKLLNVEFVQAKSGYYSLQLLLENWLGEKKGPANPGTHLGVSKIGFQNDLSLLRNIVELFLAFWMIFCFYTQWKFHTLWLTKMNVLFLILIFRFTLNLGFQKFFECFEKELFFWIRLTWTEYSAWYEAAVLAFTFPTVTAFEFRAFFVTMTPEQVRDGGGQKM